MSTDTTEDTTATNLTVTVLPVFTVPELAGDIEFSGYDEAVNYAAVTLGIGARFTVNRVNEIQAVEALVVPATYTGPIGAEPTPTPTPTDTTDTPTDTEVPDVPTDAPVDSATPSPAVPVDASVDGGTDAGTGDTDPTPIDPPATDDDASSSTPAPAPAPVVNGDDTDPTIAGPSTVTGVSDVPDPVELGSAQAPAEQPVFTPPTDTSTITDTTTVAPDTTVTWPTPPVDTSNAVFTDTSSPFTTPDTAPTATPADDTSPTEITPPADS